MFWDTVSLALSKAVTVLWVGLLFGAGLPVIFALGVRALSFGGADVEGGRSSTAGKLLAYLFFAVVAGAVALGITMIVASGMGKVVSFDHIIPMIVEKKK